MYGLLPTSGQCAPCQHFDFQVPIRNPCVMIDDVFAGEKRCAVSCDSDCERRRRAHACLALGGLSVRKHTSVHALSTALHHGGAQEVSPLSLPHAPITHRPPHTPTPTRTSNEPPRARFQSRRGSALWVMAKGSRNGATHAAIRREACVPPCMKRIDALTRHMSSSAAMRSGVGAPLLVSAFCVIPPGSCPGGSHVPLRDRSTRATRAVASAAAGSATLM